MNPITFFQFPVNKIRGALIFAAKQDIRYYLNGVFFQRAPNGKGIIAVSTDGHRLTVIYHEQDVSQVPSDWAGVILPREELERAAKFPLKADKITLDAAFIVGERITIRTAVTIECAAIEGKYPDYQRVIPPLRGRRHCGLATVNANYLADYAKLSALLKPNGRSEITISSVDANSSIVVGIGVPECVCILMPLRGSPEEDLQDRAWLSGAA